MFGFGIEQAVVLFPVGLHFRLKQVNHIAQQNWVSGTGAGLVDAVLARVGQGLCRGHQNAVGHQVCGNDVDDFVRLGWEEIGFATCFTARGV